MTSNPVQPGYASAPVSAGKDAPVMPRSLLASALFDTFGQTGAKVGLAWIALLVFLGVFAPFIANSHPLIYREVGGSLSSPLLMHLSGIDVALMILFVHAAIVVIRRPGAGMSLAAIMWPVFFVGVFLMVVRLTVPVVTLTLWRPAWLAEADASAIWIVMWAAVVVFHVAVLILMLALVAVFWIASRAYFSASTRQSRLGLLISASLAASLMSFVAIAIKAPENVSYAVYREAQQAGRVETVVRTIIPYSPNDRMYDRPSSEKLAPPSADHWMGTTDFGEDLLSRMLYAIRVALSIGLISTGIATAIGIVVGGLMGYYAGKLDLIGMRLVEIFEAIPTFVVLLIITIAYGRNLYLMMVAIGLLSWSGDARFIRAEFFRVRKLDFVQAAVAAGLSRSSIIFRHMLPNGIAPVLVNASFGIAGAILLESTLSFIGLGLGPDDPSWGALLSQASKGSSGFNWWLAGFPGFAIFMTTFAYILIGEAVRDAIDPKLKKSQ